MNYAPGEEQNEIMTTTDKPRVADFATVVHVPEALIQDNPWQPRTRMDIDELQELADSIHAQGLLQPPVARIHPDLGQRSSAGVSPYQLAFGHRRVAAIRMLISAGLWEGDVPCSVRKISDTDMALMAIAENEQRADLTPIECIKSYQKILSDIPGLTTKNLAEQLGIHRSTLANNLRLLKLPELVLERVESGDIPTHSAREFLCLQADDHVHLDLMQKVIRDISLTSGVQGAPDWGYSHVRELIRSEVHHGEANWRPLEDNTGDEGWGNDPGGERSPNFDVEAFTTEHENQIHTIPAKEGRNSRRWTCNVKEWRKRQTAGTRAANKAESEGETTTTRPAAKKTAMETALENDPILIKHREAFPGKRGKQLEPEEIKTLGTRAEVLRGYQTPKTLNYLHDETLPPGFPDIDECRTKCIWGAKYLIEYSGFTPKLVCGNVEAFNDKKSRGIEAFKKELAERIEIEDQADKIRVDLVSDELVYQSTGAIDVPLMIAETLLMALQNDINPVLPHPNGQDLRYHPAELSRAFKTILGVELDPNHNSWGPSEWDLVEALGKLQGMERGDVADLAATLLVWTERWKKGLPAL